EGDRGGARVDVLAVGRSGDQPPTEIPTRLTNGAREIGREFAALRPRVGNHVRIADLGCEIFAVAPGAQREKVVPIAVGGLAVAFMTDRWRDETAPSVITAEESVCARAEVFEEPCGANDRWI